MHVLAYENLKSVLGVNEKANRMYTFMSNAVFEPTVLDAMGGDMIVLNSKLCASPLWGPPAEGKWKDQRLWGKTFQVPAAWDFRTQADGAVLWNNGRVCPPGAIYFDTPPGSDPSPDTDNQPSPADFAPPAPLCDEMLRDLEESARWLHENTPYGIVVGETIYDLQLKPGGRVAWWMRMVTEPQACHEFLHKAVEASLVHVEQVHQAVGKYCDAMIIANDMGDGRGVTIGPKLWRSIYKPHYHRLWSRWHEITPMKAMLHSCGSIVDILDDFIECGLDVINPIQRSARGMDAQSLAARFGGALDAIATPPDSPDEVVYEQARHTIRTLAAHGRYIFAGTHNLPGDTPPGHLKAMLQAYRDCPRAGQSA